MSNVEARLKVKGKHYEIIVDLNEALKIKAGKGNITTALQSNNIFHDTKKGNIVAQKDLIEAFNTSDIYEIAKKIILLGEVQKTQEFRDEEREKKIKQLVILIVKNATDQHEKPYTEERILTALRESHYTIDNRPLEQQLTDAIHKLKEIIPIKIETKRIKLTIPAQYTGRVYGLLTENKESEEWLANGDLQVIMNIPAGLILDFYDKINSFTHGAIHSEDLKQNQP